MSVNKHIDHVYELLTRPGQRLPQLVSWLTDRVWTADRFKKMGAQQYFEQGERIVNAVEDIIAASAWGVYDEITSKSLQAARVFESAQMDLPLAIVVLDGASLREMPALLQLARETGFSVTAAEARTAAIPSDTESFVELRILGKPIAPIQLQSRSELKEQGIKAFYYDSILRRLDLPRDARSLLLWSSFPDGTYMDFEAKSAVHFETLVRQLDTVWKNVVLAIPKGYQIVITSDHGYVYLASGFDSENRGDEALPILEQKRYRTFDTSQDLPKEQRELQIIQSRRTVMIRGRVKNRIQGPAGNKLFRHGGMSLMEMLTPWIVIQKS